MAPPFLKNPRKSVVLYPYFPDEEELSELLKLTHLISARTLNQFISSDCDHYDMMPLLILRVTKEIVTASKNERAW